TRSWMTTAAPVTVNSWPPLVMLWVTKAEPPIWLLLPLPAMVAQGASPPPPAPTTWLTPQVANSRSPARAELGASKAQAAATAKVRNAFLDVLLARSRSMWVCLFMAIGAKTRLFDRLVSAKTPLH